MEVSRRRWLGEIASWTTGAWMAPSMFGSPLLGDAAFGDAAVGSVGLGSGRALGLLYGGLLGDALGGPVEFASAEHVAPHMPATREWAASRRVTAADLKHWRESLPLLGYEKLRPGAEPYGPWQAPGVAGTVTDDSRHKMVLIRAVRALLAAGQTELRAEDLARQYLAFTPRAGEQPTDVAMQQLNHEGFEEYRFASRWLLGDRDESRALPLERLWGGTANCSGQMMLPPLAAAYAGSPEAAYRAAFSLDFIDAPLARDFASALIAAIAAVLDPLLDGRPVSERWETFWSTLRDTDPFRFHKVPFAGRPLHYWLNLARELATQADGRPAKLFELLETQGQPIYWWDAHYTLLVPLSMLHFCQYDVAAALHLTLDFGHDTDSYAQVLGCIGGSIHGVEVFPATMRQTLRQAVLAEYGEDVEQWGELLSRYAIVQKGTE